MSAVTGSVRVLASAGARTGRTLVVGIARLAGWVARHRRWSCWLVVSGLLALVFGARSAGLVLLAVWLVPGLVAVVWKAAAPVGFERYCAGPARRFGWRHWARKTWPHLARECGLSVQRDARRRWWQTLALALLGRRTGDTRQRQVWVAPRLMDASTSGTCMTLFIRARTGQTVDDLTAAVPALATAAEAVSYRMTQRTPSVLEVVLVMGDQLAAPAPATLPRNAAVQSVRLGRRQDGTRFVLPLLGRQTLVVGCSGSGKGSILWGVAGGLAPAVRQDVVRLWGVDLKGGVEVGMGAPLFAATAYTHTDARAVLRRLLQVIDARTATMLGRSRLHEPRPGDPLHVLVIDELAALTSYETDSKARDEASRMLAEVLTKGRAVGVLVVAFVQDPRKDTVAMRDLFTQTLALRLKTAEQTRMVLGDGMTALAPAHKISPAAPGTGWLVLDDGTADRVRADYWPDDLVRMVAATYPAPITEPLPSDGEVAAQAPGAAPGEGVNLRKDDTGAGAASRVRKPRKPRAPRAPRDRDAAASPRGGEAA